MIMNAIKVLALNDDNHTPCFVTLGAYYSDAAEFMRECLLKPHTSTYKVAYVSLVDTALPESMSDEEFMEIFDRVATCYNPNRLFMKDEKAWREREKAFDALWHMGSEEDFCV